MGAPLTPGVLVEQKGNEGQHLQLASPAIVTFALKGKVPEQAAVVTFTDPRDGPAARLERLQAGQDDDGDGLRPVVQRHDGGRRPRRAWGDLAPLVPDYRWSLAVSGTRFERSSRWR